MASDYRGQANLPRGIRNNNPGNIDAGDSWQGAVGSDGVFIIFSDMSWGTRAIGQTLINKIKKGQNTITLMFSGPNAWSATDQAAYVQSVTDDTGIDPNAQLGTDAQTIALLIRAISNMENGDGPSYDYVTDQDISDGISKINSGLITSLAAVVVDAQSNPAPYIIAVAGIFAIYWFLSSRRRGR